MQKFIVKKGEELKAAILEQAKAELKKIENLRKVKEAEEKRRKQLEEREMKEKAEGRFEDPTETTGWSRGIAKQASIAPKDESNKKEEGLVMTRSGFGQVKT